MAEQIEKGIVSNHITSYWNAIYRKEVAVGGLKTSYLEAGEGPTVLLLHGFFGTKNHWRSVMMGLKKRYHVIAVEVPGFNLTQWLPGDKHNLRCLSEWLEQFANAIYLKSFHLVGYSSGACLAAYFAYTHPTRAISLSFISFPNIYFEEEKLFKNIFDECLYTQIQCAKDIEALRAELFFEPPKIPNYFQHIIYNVFKYRLSSLQKLLQDLSDGTNLLLPRLRQICCPVMAIRGDQDENGSKEMASYLSRTVPELVMHEIKNAKHLCYVERYNETTSILMTFIREQNDKHVFQHTEPTKTTLLTGNAK